MGWGMDGGWMPLPTHPQRYCDPASLVLFLSATEYYSNLDYNLRRVGVVVVVVVVVVHTFENEPTSKRLDQFAALQPMRIFKSNHPKPKSEKHALLGIFQLIPLKLGM